MRSARNRLGYSQESFARRANLERSNYGAIERGEFNVTLDTMLRITKGLGMTGAELMRQAKL
jgi:transcriptional regulator with XRE-family HTH domain